MMNLALEDPHFNTDDSIGGVSFGKAVVDVRAQGVQGHTAFTLPFRPGDFSTAQSAGAGNLDPLCAKFLRDSDSPFHGPTQCNTSFKLGGDIFGDKLGIGFGTTDFIHLDGEIGLKLVTKLTAQFFDLNALAPDNNPGAGGEKNQTDLIRSSFDLDFGNTCMIQLFLDELSELVVFENKLWIILLAVPPGQPVFV